ncbi:MAG: sulfite exporter TauE/SafE family protein [Nocardioides sp.]|nr:sulfite exporter TauE/SafE family protein [Nocardioides sp.]
MTLAIGALGAFLANAVGGLVGFASSLLLLPVLLLLGVPLWEAVSINLVLAILTRLPSVIALRSDIDLRRTGTMLAGSLPGIAVGVVVGGLVPSKVLEVAAAALVLLSGLYLLRASRSAVPSTGVTTTGTLLAGASSGLLGVTTSLNGVPPAVLLARSGAPVRTRLADLSVFFAVGNCFTLAAIAVSQSQPLLVDSSPVVVWILAGMAGNAVGLRLAHSLDERRFELLTIVLVLLSGIGSLVGTAL